MHLSPAERDALTLLLERVYQPAVDEDTDFMSRNAERRLMRMRASVCTRLQALTFEASIIDGERSSVLLSTDETDLVLDTLGPPPSGPLAGLQRRRTADLHRRLIRADMKALGTSWNQLGTSRTGVRMPPREIT